MKYIFGVSFQNLGKIQYFLSEEELKIDTLVIAESIRGIELGRVTTPAKEYIQEENSETLFLDIVRVATEEDISENDKNILEAQEATKIVQLESDKLGLGMKVTSAEYTLDRTKLTISYLAEDRVDFRELLKVLAALYRCRIELRQIGPRDKAKLVGGIGLCGLPLCCSTFLNEFDGISITMAKNQMLALNIPKLSGHCGKLICCLKYEDAVYTLEKKDLPRVGVRVNYNDIIYRMASINIITKMVRLESPESIINVPLSAIEDKIIHNWNPNQPPKQKEVSTPKEVETQVDVEEVKDVDEKSQNEEVQVEVEKEKKRFNKFKDRNKRKFNNQNQQEQNPEEIIVSQSDIDLEEQLIMNRLNPNLNQNMEENKGNQDNTHRNNRHHFHKRRHFNNRNKNQGNSNEEN